MQRLLQLRQEPMFMENFHKLTKIAKKVLKVYTICMILGGVNLLFNDVWVEQNTVVEQVDLEVETSTARK